MAEKKTKKTKKTKKRKPRRKDGKYGLASRIDWETARDWYVYGEEDGIDNRGKSYRRAPTLTDVARRFKCTPQAVSMKAKSQDWHSLREQRELALQAEKARLAGQAMALHMSEAQAMIDEWLLRFKGELKAGNVPTKDIIAFDRAVRAKAFIAEQMAKPRPSAARDRGFGIDALQGRYASYRSDDNEAAADDALTGRSKEDGEAFKIPGIEEVLGLPDVDPDPESQPQPLSAPE